MIPITLPEAKPLEETLALTWPVQYILVEEAAGCQIICSPTAMAHTIQVSGEVYQSWPRHIYDVAHELCHGKLAETIDPAFGTLFFSRRYNRLKGKQAQEFTYKANLMRYAWLPLEIWVNDLRHTHWPEFSRADQKSLGMSLAGAHTTGQLVKMPTFYLVAGFAQYLAEADRHKLPIVAQIDQMLHALNPQQRQAISVLRIYLKALPVLSDNPLQDLALLERSLQEVARMLSLPIKPKLVGEEGRNVWLV